jgi:hypothetical protein
MLFGGNEEENHLLTGLNQALFTANALTVLCKTKLYGIGFGTGANNSERRKGQAVVGRGRRP